MSSAGLSLFVFGIYMILSGLGFALIPNTALGMFAMPATEEPWLRILGALMVVVGYYYIQTGRKDIRSFFSWTIQARVGVFVIFVLFYFLNWAPATLLIFSAVDLLGSIWTFFALRSG
jgi:uncharacterized protein YjeT (DUF2065 family)